MKWLFALLLCFAPSFAFAQYETEVIDGRPRHSIRYERRLVIVDQYYYREPWGQLVRVTVWGWRYVPVYGGRYRIQDE